MRRPALGFAGILLGMAGSVLMQTLVATALPTIAGELGGMELYSWVFGAYMLASVVTIPLFSKLADVLGRRALYAGGLATFLGASLLAGLAANMPQLVAARTLQGIGAGAVAPAALAAVGDLFGDAGRGRAFGIIGAVQVLANLAGPALGGWITDHAGWRWGFLLMLPLGLPAGVLAWVGLPGRVGAERVNLRRLDWLGAGLLGGGLAAGLLGLQVLGAAASGTGGSGGAISETVATAAATGHVATGAGALVLSLLMLLAGLRVERRHPDPALPLALLRRPAMAQAAVGTVLVGAVTHGAIAYVPLYVREAGSLTATAAGAALLPMLLMAGVGSGVGGALERRWPREAAGAGWLLATGALAAMAALRPAEGSPLLLVATGLVGLGMGILLPLFLSAAQSAGGDAHRAVASGTVQLARNLGGAVGVPLLGIWLTLGLPRPVPAILASLAVLAGLGLLTVPRHSDPVGGR